MNIKKLTEERLNKTEENLINSHCMDLTLFNIIEKVNQFENEDLDAVLLSDLHTLTNESHISPREKEICFKYMKIIIDRNNKEE